MTTRRIQGAGVKLALREWGQAGNPLLVLVHGYPDNHAVWNRVAPALADRFHVVAYDVRGAGASDRPAETAAYRLDRLAADLRCVVEAAGNPRQFHLAAHDWGSIQSWEAVTDPEFSGRILSFTSISGPCLDHMGALIRGRMSMLRRISQGLRSLYIPAMHIPGAPAAWEHVLSRAWPWMLVNREGIPRKHHGPQESLAADGRYGMNLYRANMFERLTSPRERRTEVPVQLLLLLRDNYVKPESMEGIETWVPNLTRRELDAGHWALLSHPDEVATAVRDFAILNT